MLRFTYPVSPFRLTMQRTDFWSVFPSPTPYPWRQQKLWGIFNLHKNSDFSEKSCNPGEAECIGRAVSGKEMTYFNQNVIEKCAGQCLGSMTGWCFVLSLFWLEFWFMLGCKMSEQILNGFSKFGIRCVYLTHFTGISLSFQNTHFNW